MNKFFKKGFWNDPEGFSITDFLSILICASYFFILTLMTVGVVFGSDITQLGRILDDLKSLVMLVLAGYFTDQVSSRINARDTEIVIEELED